MIDYRLVTYRCLHFKIVAEHDLYLDENDDTSIEGLSSKPTNSQRHSKFRCGSPQCENVTQEEWLSRIKESVAQCKQYFSTSTELYFDAAHRYHNTAIAVRATTLDRSLCRVAHQQYGIESRKWDDDPFFEDWQDALETICSIEQELSCNVDEASLADAVTAINLVRAIISRVEGQLGKVIDGASFVQKKELEEDYDLVGRVGGYRGLEGFFPPVDVFARVVYEVWARRMEGFCQAFHAD